MLLNIFRIILVSHFENAIFCLNRMRVFSFKIYAAANVLACLGQSKRLAFIYILSSFLAISIFNSRILSFVEFVPHIEQLFDEEVLIGNGWTVNEGIRPLAYSTLADFAHHVRGHLSLPNLALAVHLFSKNVHDESLLISIQRMSCKVLQSIT